MRRPALLLLGALLSLAMAGCVTPYMARHEIGWNSAEQIWAAEASQVRVRNAQSRVFDTSDKQRMLQTVVTTFQDLDFQVEVLDTELGIVSGKKFVDLERRDMADYFLYDTEKLVVFTKALRSWGPFYHRSDLVRFTVTVRERSATQLVVRASAQHYLRPIEDAEPYQAYFRTLESARFLERQRSESEAGATSPSS
ncbi:MAG: hypothetical protein AAF430_13690 [Myxococcota bacterium]